MSKFNQKQISFLAERLNSPTGPSDICELPTRGRKVNRIFLIHSNGKSYILKLLEPKPDLVGEENLFDLIYDSYTHQLASIILTNFYPPRKLIFYDNTFKNPFGQQLIIQTLIDGKSAETLKQKARKQIIDTSFSGMVKLHSKMKYRSYFGLLNPEEYKSLGIKVSPWFEKNLLLKINEDKKISFISYASRYFSADVKREAPQYYKSRLLSYIESFYPYLGQAHYYLVHGDLGLKNIIRSVRHFNIIDWSRAYLGDPAQDIGDILANTIIYSGVDFAVQERQKLTEIATKANLDINPLTLNKRIKFYMSFRLFSVARVFYSSLITTVSRQIIQKTESIDEFIVNQSWAHGKE